MPEIVSVYVSFYQLLNSDWTDKFLSKNKSGYEHKNVNIKIQIIIIPMQIKAKIILRLTQKYLVYKVSYVCCP